VLTGFSFVFGVGLLSSSHAADDAPAAAPASPSSPADKIKADPLTTKDPEIALDDLGLLLAPMTKEEIETEAKGWFALVPTKEREISVAEHDVRRKNREIAQLEKQKAAATDLAKATEKVKAAGAGSASDKEAASAGSASDKEAAAARLAEAQKALVKTVETANKETAKEDMARISAWLAQQSLAEQY
jgi:hypothetical protein